SRCIRTDIVIASTQGQNPAVIKGQFLLEIEPLCDLRLIEIGRGVQLDTGSTAVTGVVNINAASSSQALRFIDIVMGVVEPDQRAAANAVELRVILKLVIDGVLIPLTIDGKRCAAKSRVDGIEVYALVIEIQVRVASILAECQ